MKPAKADRARTAHLADSACAVVDEFVFKHRAGAIPALIGAYVEWAVRFGVTDLIKESLANAIKMADEMERERQRDGN